MVKIKDTHNRVLKLKEKKMIRPSRAVTQTPDFQ